MSVRDAVVPAATESLQVDIIKQLIEAGCDVNSVDNDHHSTVLHRVVRYCQYTILYYSTIYSVNK